MNKRFVGVLHFRVRGRVGRQSDALPVARSTGRASQSAAPVTVQIVLAATDLEVGTVLKEDDVKLTDWPGAVPLGASIKASGRGRPRRHHPHLRQGADHRIAPGAQGRRRRPGCHDSARHARRRRSRQRSGGRGRIRSGRHARRRADLRHQPRAAAATWARSPRLCCRISKCSPPDRISRRTPKASRSRCRW